MIYGTDDRTVNHRFRPAAVPAVADLIDIEHTPTWSKPWENETIEKSYRKVDRDQSRNYKTSHYAPMSSVRPKKSSNAHKYFPGNGKPQGFFIMRKSEKPLYQKLIS